MNADEVRDFASRLMNEVWIPFDHEAVPKFYHADVVGHHRGQSIRLDDIVNRLRWDSQTFTDAVYDIRGIVADVDKFAVRFLYTSKVVATGQPANAETTYFYHLRDGKISEFWLLADIAFDYKQRPSG